MTSTDRAAILGGRPLCAEPFPRWPIWDDHERDALTATLDSGGWWDGDGDRAARFACDFAAYHGAAHGLAMTNGTHTLEAALAACDVGEGDGVDAQRNAALHEERERADGEDDLGNDERCADESPGEGSPGTCHGEQPDRQPGGEDH